MTPAPRRGRRRAWWRAALHALAQGARHVWARKRALVPLISALLAALNEGGVVALYPHGWLPWIIAANGFWQALTHALQSPTTGAVAGPPAIPPTPAHIVSEDS